MPAADLLQNREVMTAIAVYTSPARLRDEDYCVLSDSGALELRRGTGPGETSISRSMIPAETVRAPRYVAILRK